MELDLVLERSPMLSSTMVAAIHSPHHIFYGCLHFERDLTKFMRSACAKCQSKELLARRRQAKGPDRLPYETNTTIQKSLMPNQVYNWPVQSLSIIRMPLESSYWSKLDYTVI